MSMDERDEPMVPRSSWVRRRLLVPELERLLGGPIGTRLSGNFDSLKVRIAKAVERIGQEAEAAGEEIRRRAAILRLGILSSAVLGIGAMTVAVSVPAYRVPAGLIAAVELASLPVLRFLQR